MTLVLGSDDRQFLLPKHELKHSSARHNVVILVSICTVFSLVTYACRQVVENL